jgi:hypothetical protein
MQVVVICTEACGELRGQVMFMEPFFLANTTISTHHEAIGPFCPNDFMAYMRGKMIFWMQ